MIMMHCCTKKKRKNSIANIMTSDSDWGRFEGPPSASEWAFGRAGRSNAVQSRSGGREVGVRAQHENKARSRFHRALSVKSVKFCGRKAKV